MIAVDLLSEIFILIVLGIYLKRNNVIDGHTVDQLTDLIVKIWYTHIQFWDMKCVTIYLGGFFMGKLDNKVAIITGGNAGVGKEIAKLFASEGAKVVISARRQQVLEEAAKEIEAAGGTVLCVPTDISKVDDVKNLKVLEENVKSYLQM